MQTLYPARPGERPFTAEDLWAVPRVDPPVPAPNAPLLAVAVRRFDMEANAGRSRIWQVPVDAGEPRPLTSAEHDSSQPVFAPDGGRLAFVRKVGEHAQLFVMPMDAGEAERVTDLPLGVTDPRWLPDGSGIQSDEGNPMSAQPSQPNHSDRRRQQRRAHRPAFRQNIDVADDISDLPRKNAVKNIEPSAFMTGHRQTIVIPWTKSSRL